MSNTPDPSLVPSAPQAVAVYQPPPVEFTPDQVAILARQIGDNLTHDEIHVFLHQCKRTRLDPFVRQIYGVKREGKLTVQVSIDGMRLIAQRSGEYQGQTAPQWCGEDGVWVDVWLDDDMPPKAARVGIYRAGFREPVYGVARFNAYAQSKSNGELNRMWAKMGDVMIAKCAEALALRKAFPNELSGLYTTEEMDQAPGGVPRGSAAVTETVDTRTGEILEADGTRKAASPAHEVVLSVEVVRSGTGARGPWKLYLIKTNRREVKTFEEEHATIAREAFERGYGIELRVTEERRNGRVELKVAHIESYIIGDNDGPPSGPAPGEGSSHQGADQYEPPF